MTNILLILTFFLTAVTTALPWHHRGRHHHHHHRKHPKHPKVTSSPALPSRSAIIWPTSPVASNPSAFATGTSIPPSSPSSHIPTGVFSTSKPAAVTASATGIRPSASRAPVIIRNGTAPVARSGTAIAPSATPSAAPSTGKPCADFLRGVNIGGWLLLDSVLNAKLLAAADATGQWSYDSSEGAAAKLDDHWKTYFTESDMQSLSQYGINAVKIPVGYWAWDNYGTPYKQGADAYLEAAIGWAAAAGIKVWIDVSNTDASANTFAEASPDYAVTHSLNILTEIATKYGGAAHADTVVAIQIFSSPIASSNTANPDSFIQQAYSTVRKAASNPNLQVILPDGSSSPQSWVPLAQSCDSTKGMLSVSESMSQLSCPCEQSMTQRQHIQHACERGYNMAGLNHNSLSIYVGDFNPATNATIYTEGWTDDVVTDVRKYVEANLAVFEAYTSGYFFWSWAVDAGETAGAGWGFKDGMDKGWIPMPLNDRSKFKYPGQCDV